MKPRFSKVSNLKTNNGSNEAIPLASSTFFYELGNSPILKNILVRNFSCPG
tara:strand:- start:232 stop:384 length:153 start_codon:yes stop_codon:yes gene_type:complete